MDSKRERPRDAGPPRETGNLDLWRRFSARVAHKERRRRRAEREGDRAIWLGMGMFGLVGWSIALPTLAGLLVGLWLDSRWGGETSWTLALMLAGLTLGLLNVWRWMQGTVPADEDQDDQAGDEER